MLYKKITDRPVFEIYVDGNNLIIENNSDKELNVFLNDFLLFQVSGFSTLTLYCVRMVGNLKFNHSDNTNLNFKIFLW